MTGQKPKVIAVFGRTGAGKTTFINNVTGAQLDVGHGMKSIESVDTKIGNTDVTLVDTPGFDDTHRSDTEVLTELANWLKVHPLTDQKMYGSALKNLNMFMKLCGADNLGHVLLVTTMWNVVSNQDGEARAKELKESFWEGMIRRGSSVQRVGNDAKSAQGVVRKILPRDEITLRLQSELASGKTLDETDVGKIINAELNKMRDEYKANLDNALKEEREKWQKKLKELEKEQKKLKTEKIAMLPRATRRWWQRSWRCLRNCTTKSRNDGVWQCATCHQEQYNVRY